MSNYEHYTKNDLLSIIEKQAEELKNKKYGLVWDSEREPEQVVLDCENNLPVLTRVKDKEIRTTDDEDNILIEGDNYHALTVLSYTHKEQIDVIYIDPPYNTGNKDFIYNDNYVDKEDGYRHSKWLNFMEKRLNLAKDLLQETGAIFISIDDNEMPQLKMLCDKVFGEDNFIANLIWKSKSGGANDSQFFAIDHEYILVYAKQRDSLIFNPDIEAEVTTSYNLTEKDGRQYGLERLDKQSIRYSKSLDYEIVGPDGQKYYPKHKNPKNPNATWRWGKKTVEERYSELVFKNGSVYTKNYQSKDGSIPRSLLVDERFGRTRTGKTRLFEIFGKEEFQNPKPVKLLQYILMLMPGKDLKILDFMAGSGTLGEAVLELNKNGGGKCNFILCTSNELNGVGKELFDKLGGKTVENYGICRRVTYPRLESVIKGYKKNGNGEKVEGLGGNLQYFRTGFVKRVRNQDQMRVSLTSKCTEMLCVKENIFNLKTEKPDFKVFASNKNDKFLCVYYDFVEQSFTDFLKEVKKLKGQKIIYMFSIDGKVDKKLFAVVDDFTLEEIPQKILEIYKQIIKMNLPVKIETMFLDFNKANKALFEDKDKDESARLLRVVLEKLIQKASQINGISILSQNSKEEKATVLNDKLKAAGHFNHVDWEENRTCLAIGNHASHGEYHEYDIEQVQHFYQHVQGLINKFNL